MQFIQKHIGCIVLVVVLFAFIAPRILTLPGAEWLDLTQTGEIGDTIGGTTAPFWGFLSIILLYLTLKEQQRFNKDQQKFNEKFSSIPQRSRRLVCDGLPERVVSGL